MDPFLSVVGCTTTKGFSVKTIAAILRLPKFPFRKTYVYFCPVVEHVLTILFISFFSPIKFPVGRCDYRQRRRSDPQDPWRLWCEHHDRRAPSGFHWTDHHHFRLVASDMESAISASAEVNQPSVVESCAVPSGEKIKKRNVKRRIVYHHRLLWYGRLVILLFGIKTGNKKSLVHLPRQLHSSRLVLSLSPCVQQSVLLYWCTVSNVSLVRFSFLFSVRENSQGKGFWSY